MYRAHLPSQSPNHPITDIAVIHHHHLVAIVIRLHLAVYRTTTPYPVSSLVDARTHSPRTQAYTCHRADAYAFLKSTQVLTLICFCGRRANLKAACASLLRLNSSRPTIEHILHTYLTYITYFPYTYTYTYTSYLSFYVPLLPHVPASLYLPATLSHMYPTLPV